MSRSMDLDPATLYSKGNLEFVLALTTNLTKQFRFCQQLCLFDRYHTNMFANEASG